MTLLQVLVIMISHMPLPLMTLIYMGLHDCFSSVICFSCAPVTFVEDINAHLDLDDALPPLDAAESDHHDVHAAHPLPSGSSPAPSACHDVVAMYAPPVTVPIPLSHAHPFGIGLPLPPKLCDADMGLLHDAGYFASNFFL
jgi:hypothetical protein